MTCRHKPGDPDCGSHARNSAAEATQAEKRRADQFERELAAMSPDKTNYQIIDAQRVGTHIVLKVRYPNCIKCAYEGSKVMVFLNVTEGDVLKWRTIDPHFRNPKEANNLGAAPPPAARFPASSEGWSDALTYARGKAHL